MTDFTTDKTHSAIVPFASPDPGPIVTSSSSSLARIPTVDELRISRAIRLESQEARGFVPWLWAGVGLAIGVVPLFAVGLMLQVQGLPEPHIEATPPIVVEPEPPPESSGPQWWVVIPLGLILGGVIAKVASADTGHPDCPNHCPSNAPCSCGQRVSVSVEIDRF